MPLETNELEQCLNSVVIHENILRFEGIKSDLLIVIKYKIYKKNGNKTKTCQSRL